MKRLLALFIVLSLLLSACSTVCSNNANTGGSTESTQLGTPDSTSGTTASTEGSGETDSTETTLGTENTTGATIPITGETQGTQPTQGNTQPTEGGSTPTEGSKPTVTEPPATEETTQPTTNPSTPTSPTIPTTPTTPTNPTTPTTPTEPVTPTQPAVTLTINTKAFTTVSVGNTLQIDYTYTGTSKLTWYIDGDTSVATVDNSGKLTAKSAGNVGVVVTDGSLTKVVSIIISDAPKSTELHLFEHNAPLYNGVVKYAGDYMNFKVSTLPNESNPNISVTSSNTSVISVSWTMNAYSINKVTLNFKSAGTATVTITSADGNVSESYSITVTGDYDCNPGSGQLTPEEFAYCCNKVVEANGFTISSYASSYKYLYLSDAELTWANAREHGEAFAHSWWINGCRYVNITYVGLADNGEHLFYTHHG